MKKDSLTSSVFGLSKSMNNLVTELISFANCFDGAVNRSSFVRSREATKRKAVPKGTEVNGPCAKKAKQDVESSSEEDSSSDEEDAAPVQKTPQGKGCPHDF